MPLGPSGASGWSVPSAMSGRKMSPTPFSIPAGPFKVGLFVTVTLSGNVNGSLTLDRCPEPDAVNSGGGGLLSGSVGGTGLLAIPGGEARATIEGRARCPVELIRDQLCCRLNHNGVKAFIKIDTPFGAPINPMFFIIDPAAEGTGALGCVSIPIPE